MSGYGSDLDNQPIGYWNRKPIYLTLYLTGALLAGMIVVLLLGAGDYPAPFVFSPNAFRHGALWQPLTYVFVNELNFFTPLGLFMFYMWTVQIEMYLGRRKLLMICAALVFVPVLVLSAFELLTGAPGPLQIMRPLGPAGIIYSDYFLLAGLLVAFATLYPDIDYLFGWVPLKWFAFACVVCGSLMYFAKHRWDWLLALWGNCFVAFMMVRHGRGLLDLNFDWRRFWPRKKTKLRVLPHPEMARTPVRASTAIADQVDETEAEMDALLDKIAKSGVQSLNGAEKARLETLRQRLLRKQS